MICLGFTMLPQQTILSHRVRLLSRMKNAAILPLVLVVQLVSSCLAAEGVSFDRAFSPLDGLVARYEEPCRQEICLNGRWKFQGDQNTAVPGADAAVPGPWET